MSQNCNCHGATGKYSQTVVGALEKPIFETGQTLHSSDLTAAVDYTQSLNRMLFKYLFGCGVICGLEVKAGEHCGLKIEVSSGLALDGCGDAVQLAKPVSFTFDERESEKIGKNGKSIWVVLCGKEKLCAPRALVCDADDFNSVNQMTRARAMAEVSLVFEKPECICAWEDVKEHDYGVGAAKPRCVDPYPFDCAEDCGCGSACSCGCCVLLGEVKLTAEGPVATHLGVRRIAKPALMKDSRRCPAQGAVDTPAKPEEPATSVEPIEQPSDRLTEEQQRIFDAAILKIDSAARQKAKEASLTTEQTDRYLKDVVEAVMQAVKQGKSNQDLRDAGLNVPQPT